MQLTDTTKDFLQGLKGAVKSALSLAPGLGQAIAGYDNYQRSKFERNIKHIIEHLQNKTEDIESLFSSDWLKTEEGQLFSRKIFDSALDAQLEDKQELFINAFINGVREGNRTDSLEKLKFVDMLRGMSLASLMVLSEMHKMFVEDVRGPNRNPDPIQSFPLVKAENIANELSEIFHPYLVNSAVKEMEGHGLFSNIGDWQKSHDGTYRQAGGFLNEMCYTDFAAKFVEFITIKEK